jgi:hypothetical protein
MKKTVSRTLIALLAAGMLSFPAFAADYSAMSNEELSALRGTMRTATDQERDAFRQEWQKRVHAMTPEEAESYRGRPANAAADGQGYRSSNTTRSGSCDGSGQGRGRRGGRRMN